jgi:hypothetical protein
MPPSTLDPNEKPSSATPLRRRSDQPATTPEAVAEQPENPFHFAVDELDVEALKSIKRNEFPYGALRLWWEPFAARRGAGVVKPTHVTVVAETEAEKRFALQLLEEDRARRALAKSVVGHGRVHDKKPDTAQTEVCETPKAAEPTPPKRPWGYGFGGSETY